MIVKGLASRNISAARQELIKIFRHLNATRPPCIQQVRQLGQSQKFNFKFSNSGDKFFLLKLSPYLRKTGLSFEDVLPPKLQQAKNMLLRRKREMLDNGVAKSVHLHRRFLPLRQTNWYYGQKTNHEYKNTTRSKTWNGEPTMRHGVHQNGGHEGRKNQREHQSTQRPDEQISRETEVHGVTLKPWVRSARP